MANIKGFNVSGQKITPNTYGIHEREKYTGSITGLEASQNSTPDMNVLIQVGTAVLTKNTNSSVVAVLDTPTTITIATANTSNPRIDTIVVYEDLSVTMPTAEPYSIDAVGRFKIVSVAGTPATSPSASNDATIQSAIGGTNTSWARICTVLVDKNATTIINSKIDNSVKLPLSPVIPNGSVGTNQIAPGAVTADKMNLNTYSGWATVTALTTGQKFASFTQVVPAGKYMVIWNAKLNANAVSGDYIVSLVTDSTTIATQTSSTSSYSVPMTTIGIFTNTSPVTVKFAARSVYEGSSAFVEGNAFIIRIG